MVRAGLEHHGAAAHGISNKIYPQTRWSAARSQHRFRNTLALHLRVKDCRLKQSTRVPSPQRYSAQSPRRRAPLNSYTALLRRVEAVALSQSSPPRSSRQGEHRALFSTRSAGRSQQGGRALKAEGGSFYQALPGTETQVGQGSDAQSCMVMRGGNIGVFRGRRQEGPTQGQDLNNIGV